MSRRALATILAVCIIPVLHSASAPSGQGAARPFQTCGWWQDLDKSDKTIGLYKVGFAQGIVVGALSDILGKPSGQDATTLLPLWEAGETSLMQKPAIMADALDTKCADYRNARVFINQVAFLVTLEIGGLKQQRSDAAMELLRLPNLPPKEAILAVLAGR